MTDSDIIADLTHGGTHLEDYVVVGEGEQLSIFTGRPNQGMAILHVEDSRAHAAYVAFLAKRGARRFATIREFGAFLDWDGIARVEQIDDPKA